MRNSFFRRISFSAWSGLLFCGLLSAQADQASAPTVTFTCDFPGSDPSHYVISASSDGRGSYVSDGKLTSQSEADPDQPVRLEFNLTAPTRSRIFDLAKRAHYFEGEMDSKKKGLAATGIKTLTYMDAQRSNKGSYNYSPIAVIQELTALFQNLSTTLEFGRRLEYHYRYQKLALDEDLKQMEDMSKAGGLVELSAIAPSLQKIELDTSVINIVRARAQRLLALTEAKGF